MRGSPKQLVLTLGITFGLMAYIGFTCYYTMEVLHWPEAKTMVFVMSSSLILAGIVLWQHNRISVRINGPQMKADFERMQQQAAAKREEMLHNRADELRRDPKRSKYADEVERGKFLTDAQIDYMDNPAARLSCRHMQGVEGLMRAHGVRVMPVSDVSLTAECVLDEAALRKLITLDDFVLYREYFDDRDAEAWLQCMQCQRNITVWHPVWGGTKFPAS